MTNRAAPQTQYPAFDTQAERGYAYADAPDEAAAAAAEHLAPLPRRPARYERLSISAFTVEHDTQHVSVFKDPELAKNVLATVIGLGTVILFAVTLYANHALK